MVSRQLAKVAQEALTRFCFQEEQCYEVGLALAQRLALVHWLPLDLLF